MRDTHMAAFVAGILFGAFFISIPLNRNIEYWKGSYCIHTPHDLDFCDEYAAPTTVVREE